MRNTVLAVQPDSFPKIRRIGTKIENPLLRVPRNYSSRVEFSKSDRYSGAGHEYRRGIVPGLENRLTLRLTYIPSREKKDSAVWAHAIQYNSPSTGPPPFFRNRLLRRLKAALSRASPSKRREEKKDSIRGMLEYVEPYVNADQRTVQFCLFALPLSTFIVCVIWRALCSVTSIPSSSLSTFASSLRFKLEKKSRFD